LPAAPPASSWKSDDNPKDHNESGRCEVSVTAFPSTGERWQVSDNGGVQPVWRQDSRELYYLRLDGVLAAVAFQTGDQSPFSVPTRLFNTELGSPSPYVEQYAASAVPEVSHP
jgi:hypothetical protein